MNEQPKTKLSTEPYKGVRDFYPEDMAIQNYIFSVWKNVLESFGYEEYSASMLEPSELYKAKSGEEIVNEQTYTFVDRGEREVTIRPEMTPTVARMVAGRRRELSFPLRWFSIPNLFRYERPQKGRLREHWQLNADIFGPEVGPADSEIIQVARGIMQKFGLADSNYKILINNRQLNDCILREVFGLNAEQAYKTGKLIDRMNKMTEEEFIKELTQISGDSKKSEELHILLKNKNLEAVQKLINSEDGISAIRSLENLFKELLGVGITNAIYDPSLMRGFDYYTGTVFELFDNDPENKRAICGGGRYDDLVSLFGQDKIPAIGFGLGDVTMRDVLETYKLLPVNQNEIDLYIIAINLEQTNQAWKLAEQLREFGLKVIVDFEAKKLGDRIGLASKKQSSYVCVLGEEEIKTGFLKLKNLVLGSEESFELDDYAKIVNHIQIVR